MSARTAEVIYVGNAASLIKASQEAAAASAAATDKIAASADKMGAASTAAAAKHEAAMAKIASAGKYALGGMVAVGAASVDMASKLEHSTASIAASGGTSAAAAKKISDAFLGTAGSAAWSAAKIGEAYATVAGELKTVEGHALSSAQAMSVMHSAMDLAEATGNELKSTTEDLGKVMLTYGLHTSEAAKTSDILFSASKNTGVALDQVTQTVDRIHGRLGALAPSLQESAGLMDALAQKGVTGRLVMGALNGTFNTLLGGGKATNAMLAELGVHVFDNAGKFVGLTSVIAQLHPKLAGLTEQSQLQATRALFGASANKQMLEIIREGPQSFERATTAVAKHGAATEAAKRQHETFSYQIKVLRASVEDLGAKLGQVLIPILQKVITVSKEVVDWFKHNEDAAKALAVVVSTVLGAAIGVYVATKVQAFIDGTKAMITGLGLFGGTAATTATEVEVAAASEASAVEASAASIEAANVAAGASFTAMLGPIAAVTAGVVALNAILPKGGNVESLLGGNQPGESGAEGMTGIHAKEAREAHAKKYSVGASGFHGAAVEEEAKRYGIDPKVLWGVFGNETSYGSNINTSSAGAMGAFQFIPETAAAYHYPMTNHPNASQFKEQAGAAAKYLSVLIKQNHGNVSAALQQYSGNTPGYAQNAYQHGQSYSPTGSGTLPSMEAITKAHSPAKVHKLAAEHYVDPFSHASGLVRGRTDQGVDFGFSGALGSIGNSVVTAIRQDPGGFGTEVIQQLLSGSRKGQYVYSGLETGATLATHVGAHLRAGQAYAYGRGTGGIEMGFARDSSGVPITPFAPGASHERPTAGGLAFSHFLGSLGKGGTESSGLNKEYEGLVKAEEKQRTADMKAGQSELNKLLGGIQSGSLKALEGLLTGTHAQKLNELQVKLAGSHNAALQKLDVELVGAHRTALTKMAEAIQANFAKTMGTISEKITSAITKAVAAWEKAESKRMADKHTDAVNALNASPEEQSLDANKEATEKEQIAATERSNAKALEEAKKKLREAKGNENPREVKTAEEEVKRSEEAITQFTRDQDNKRKEKSIASRHEAIDAEYQAEQDSLEKRKEDYEALLKSETDALVKQLAGQEILYAKFVADVKRILVGTGITLPGAGPGPSGEVPVVIGEHPQPVTGSRASGGNVYAGFTYEVGELGRELYTPTRDGRIAPAGPSNAAAGIKNDFHGDVHMNSHRDTDRFAHKLAHHLAFGGRA